MTACGNDNPGLHPLDKNAATLAFGDSLTYGTGTGRDLSYPQRLAKLTARQVINAGVPGEVTREGVRCLPQLLKRHKLDPVRHTKKRLS